MKVAVEQAGAEVALRAARILLAERELQKMGLLGGEPKGRDKRVESVSDLSEYDVIITDAPDPEEIIERALEARISCAVWDDGVDLDDKYGEEFAAVGATLLTGVNVANGLAPSLAAHETARGGEKLDATIAWTEPGVPLRTGEAIPFPEPVGPRWAEARPSVDGFRAFAAPVTGDWAGAIARVTSAGAGGVTERVVGVADLAAHLEALALSAGALAIDLYAPGAHRPSHAAELYLARALEAGLGVATFTNEPA